MRRAGLVLLLLLAPFVPQASAASFTVTAANFAWSPAALEIAVGDSVTFANGGGTHTWVRDDATDSCNLPCTRTFATGGSVGYHCGIHAFMTGSIQVGPGVTIDVATPSPGATVAGLVHVAGRAAHGSEAIASVTLRFDARTPISATLVPEGDGVSWQGDLDSLVLAEGAHDVVVRATSALGAFREARVNVTVDNPDRLDLVLATVSAPSAATGLSTSVTFAVRNDGNVASGPVLVRAEYLYHDSWRLIGEITSPQVLAGASRTGSITWDPAGVLVGTFPIRAIADPDALLVDADRANNERTGSGGWLVAGVEGIDLTEPI